MKTTAQLVLESLLIDQRIEVKKITIEILDGRFRWVLSDGDRNVFCGTAGPDQIHAMTRSTEHLVAASLGVLPPSGLGSRSPRHRRRARPGTSSTRPAMVDAASAPVGTEHRPELSALVLAQMRKPFFNL